MGIFVQPSGAAGFVSFWGSISVGAANTLNLPEGQINIGGNGRGYVIDAVTGWSPWVAENNDGTPTGLTLGDDIYLYACATDTGVAKILASKSATYPTGYTAATSRKIGGFHIGRIRGVANRYDLAYVPVVGIVPNSVWDLQHRPTCDPTGMVEVVPGKLWADIYLNSEGPGTWPETVPVSRYGVMPLRDDTYARSDFHQLARNAGKRLPTMEEWLCLAEGAPQGADGNNDYAWSRTANTGPTTTGNVAKSISQLNLADTVGNLWEWIDNHYGLNIGAHAWLTAPANAGRDAAIPRGQAYTPASSGASGWRAWIGGGTWDDGARCGARCLHSDANPQNAIGIVGLRCVCDAL